MMILAQIENWRPAASEFFLFSPEFAWVGALCALMIAPLIVGRNPRTMGTIALVSIGVIAWFNYLVADRVADGGLAGLSPDLAGGMLIADNLTVFFKFVLLAFLAGVTVLWWSCSADEERDAPEFFVLLLGSALGMSLMVSTRNLLMMMVAIEFASLPSYAMVGFNKKSRLSAEASLKYVIFGGVSAAIMLYGISLTYGFCGTLDMAQVAQIAVETLPAGGANMLALGFGFVCVFAGIAFKISAVPFHFWCPDAFQGAKTEVTTWLSVASKGAGLLLLLRIVQTFSTATGGESLPAIAWVIAILACVTCTVGNLAAYMQSSVKRLLAYSSIAHAGYMMMAAAIFMTPSAAGSLPAISAVLAYLVIYMFMNLGAFGVTAMVERSAGGDSIDGFTGLMRRSPWLALPMLFCLVSLVGLPPLAGFMAKFWLVFALSDAGTSLYYSLFVVIVINTLFSLWYYMRIVIAMMLKDDGRPAIAAPTAGLVLVNVCGILLFLLLVRPQPLKDRADRYASKLFGGAAAVDDSQESLALREP